MLLHEISAYNFVKITLTNPSLNRLKSYTLNVLTIFLSYGKNACKPFFYYINFLREIFIVCLKNHDQIL